MGDRFAEAEPASLAERALAFFWCFALGLLIDRKGLRVDGEPYAMVLMCHPLSTATRAFNDKHTLPRYLLPRRVSSDQASSLTQQKRQIRNLVHCGTLAIYGVIVVFS